jgi:hypothetical protein
MDRALDRLKCVALVLGSEGAQLVLEGSRSRRRGAAVRGAMRLEMCERVLGLVVLALAARVNGLEGSRCGGLPQPSVYINFPTLAFVPHGLPAQCAQWEGRKACCTPAAAQAALDAQAALLADRRMFKRGGDHEVIEHCSRDHCFMQAFNEARGECVSQLEWVACARQCDPRMPRNVSDGQPLQLCYETFTPRVGVDRVLYGSLDTACERAKQIMDLGDCGAVLVVGQRDAAIAAGSGQAICSASGRLVAAPVAALALSLLLLQLLSLPGR